MTLFVSVNRNLLMSRKPPFEIRQDRNDKNPQRVTGVEFTGTIRLVWMPDNPMTGGAMCWVEIDPVGEE